MVTSTSSSQSMRERMTEYITNLQDSIIAKLEMYSPASKFRRESWTREEGGGGLSCTFPPLDIPPVDDRPIEKAGVNISTIHGILPPAAIKQMSTAHAALKDIDRSLPFFTTGLSLVLHPRNPRAPGVHANHRHFEVLDGPLPPRDPTKSGETPDPQPKVLAWWFGVVIDMTPFYVNKEDFRDFHTTLKAACDKWSNFDETNISVYSQFKKSCDDYLFITHRKEHRGIGGVRFDDMDSDAMRALLVEGPGISRETVAHLSSQESLFGLVESLGNSFLSSFEVILERRRDDPLIPSERRWQLLRRGRSVEFNLVVDRGTKFGLAVPGVMAENVLMGMPPEARWEYCSDLGSKNQGGKEAEMMKILKAPRDWAEWQDDVSAL
ncbi:coproporphyrinogen III oxidase [Gyrodon lividus]|nr:coproporphyrinogen III oxidase [Gyrodon lividus]